MPPASPQPGIGGTKVEQYRARLRELDDWDAFLRAESRLPGRRANLELIHAAAAEGRRAQILAWVAADTGARDTPDEFVVLCGIVGLGKLVAAGDRSALAALRRAASDPRWRVREAVAMALQRSGESDFDLLIPELRQWTEGNPLERRAVVAALCEPALLIDRAHVRQVLDLLDRVTASLQDEPNPRDGGVRTLRQALGYGWSVVVAAAPELGKPRLERWFAVDNADIRWAMRENLKKARLQRLDPAWVERWRDEFQHR